MGAHGECSGECPGGSPEGPFDFHGCHGGKRTQALCLCGKSVRIWSMPRPRSAELGEPKRCPECAQSFPFTAEFWKPNSSGNKIKGKKFHNFRGYCRSCLRLEDNRYARRKIAQIKKEAVAIYGGKCICCGEQTVEFLTFDHINNDGAQHRRQSHKARKHIQVWLKEQGWPPIVRLLCWNCHMAQNGGRTCPHKAHV